MLQLDQAILGPTFVHAHPVLCKNRDEILGMKVGPRQKILPLKERKLVCQFPLMPNYLVWPTQHFTAIYFVPIYLYQWPGPCSDNQAHVLDLGQNMWPLTKCAELGQASVGVPDPPKEKKLGWTFQGLGRAHA